MPSLLQTDLPSIMKTVEVQLLNFVPQSTNKAVIGDISNVYWVYKGQQPPPGRTGQRDILLIALEEKMVNVQGDGRFCMVYSGIDINLRTTTELDRGGTEKQWMIRQWSMVNALMDAMMDFFPVDSDENAYTVESFVLDTNADPEKRGDSATWGEMVGRYHFHYLPNINTSLLTPEVE